MYKKPWHIWEKYSMCYSRVVMVKSQNRNPINIKRIGGYLHKAVPVLDGTGKIINYSLKPLMVEFHFRDLMQIIVGSFILAIPIAFTEEVWHLSEELPLKNIIFLSLTSLFFISFFIYFNFYKTRLKFYKIEFSKRVLATYLVSALAVAGF